MRRVVTDTMRVNLSRKDLSQRRKGAEFLRKFVNFLSFFAPWRLCVMKFGIKLTHMVTATEVPIKRS